MKKWMKIAIPLGALVILAAWYAFRPERLVVNRQVDEAMPGAQANSPAQLLESGHFYSILHPTQGIATIYQLADGSRIPRLTNFTTSNGPDVQVYMVASDDAKDVATVQQAGFIDLGVLKGNIGDQNYQLVSGVDLAKYRAVSIWCKRFIVNFGAAPLKTNFGFRKKYIRHHSIRIHTAAMKTHVNSKPAIEEFDIVILGGGTGGTIAAWTFASEGRRVAVIERKYIGGSCPNIACLPSKNVIHSAKVASYFVRGREFGVIGVDGGFTIDMRAVRERKRKMVSSWNDVYRENYKASRAKFILGSGRFIAPRTIEVELADGTRRQLRGENVIVNTGTHAALEPIPGLADAQPLTHIEALELDEVPSHLIVLGSGYIGLEFAQAMRRFGSNVTVIGRSPRFLPTEDDDVSDGVHRLFTDEHIEVVLDAKVTHLSGKSGESVTVHFEKNSNGNKSAIEASHLLVATGRTPNTQGIGLDIAGVELTETGYIKTNERLATTAPGVWAIGEVAGSPMFTHVSIADFRVVHDSLTRGNRVTTGRKIPFCLFIDPELARYGLSEKEAQAQNIPYRLFKIPMEAVMRATTMAETRGFLKALVRAQTDEILGFTAFGVGAAEIMTSVQIAMSAAVPYTALRDSILTHPTLVEGLVPLFTSPSRLHRAPVNKSASA
jgi:pyruvate/2-oxoglutarate dehydrogenase complex dihydrolipoamide dehydrogenase (E3) component